MTDQQPGSAGFVETQTATIQLPPEGFELECGERLTELTVAYETYGALTPKRDNAICICHALTADAHVAGYHDPNKAQYGWWDGMVGPGKGIDTDHYFVVCANILGGCKGTTGPSSTNPATGKPYGSAFPKISVNDIVRVQRLLLSHLGIERLAAVIGGSVGGMQVLEWMIAYPDTVDRAICIASGAAKSTQSLAFDVVARESIMSDPDWQGGDYYETGRIPSRGLARARKIGHITYLSQEMMARKFGRLKREKGSAFEIESYLEHQGEKLVRRFDANSYLRITEAIDEFDLVERYGGLQKAFEPVTAKVLVVSLSADWLFRPEQSVELANALLASGKRVSYCELQAPHGHDAFLVETESLSKVVRAFLPWIRKADNNHAKHRPRPWLGDRVAAAKHETRMFESIVEWVRPKATVLDLGCGNGELLTMLAEERSISGVGVDIDFEHVVQVMDRGHEVFQRDIDGGLAMIPDRAYDYAILSETLQVVRKPSLVLRELLRVAEIGIVSFPNFGAWSQRLELGLSGRMPKGGASAFKWFDTPDIRPFTLRDFIELCRQDSIAILDRVCIPDGRLSRAFVRLGFQNLGAERVLAKIARA